MYDNGYVPPILTVDNVVFQIIDSDLSVLLIRRNREPFTNYWALPGGYIAAGETTNDASVRVLGTKAGLNHDSLGLIEQLFTFDTVARDPRGHAVSVTYMGLGRDIHIETSATTQNPQFFPVKQLPQAVAYDHTDIIHYAHERLKAKVGYTNAVFALLPKTFTLTQLQTAYETVLDRVLDKRNFRKKFLSLNLVQETDEMMREGAHRPARLYTFNEQSLETLSRSFD